MLYERLTQVARERADRLAVADAEREMTFAQLAAAAGAMGRMLAERAGEDDAPIALLLPTGCGFAVAFHAVQAAGRVALPLNYLLAPGELAHVVAHSGAKIVVASRYFEKLIAQIEAGAGQVGAAAAQVGANAARVGADVLFIEDLADDLASAAAGPTQQPSPAKGVDDITVLLYTSGSSGMPKGVMLTAGNLLSNVDGCIEHLDITPDQTFLGVLPLFHTFGLTAMLLVPTLLGATVHYRPRFVPRQIVDTIRDRDVSIFMAVPSMFGALMSIKEASPSDFAHLRLAISGGEPLPAPLADAFQARFDTPILQGYGLTETSPVVAINHPDTNRPGTVGRPLPDLHIRILDDDGRPCPPGQPGEIVVHGPCVMKGYYRDPEATRQAMTPDGGLLTGDMGFLDADGYLAVSGRKKEMIIVAGENVFPAEVEQVLDRHDKVARSAVIGIPSDQAGDTKLGRGEVIVAFVAPADPAGPPTETELRSYCRDKLAGYKIPRRIQVVDELPTSASGKILRKALRDQLH